MEPGSPRDAEDARLRPTYAVVSRSRLRDNLAAVKALVAPARVMVILKANAYGHGLEAVARCLASQADAFGVALVEEGITLRQLGIENPILVMGGVWTRQIPLFLEHGLTFTAPSLARLRDIEEAAAARNATARVHLKIDTGMERIGVHHYHAEGLLEAAARSAHVEVDGIYSHLSNADADDLADARHQLERFEETLRFYERRSLPRPQRHIANSAALLRMPESHLDLVRAGILTYGVYPFPGAPRAVEVKPALAWKSRVVFFKVVEPGSPVSYGGTWSSDHRVRVVTVPVGYGDGYFRSMSNRAEVILRGRRYPQVGRICMDQVMVNIEWGTGYNGDEVVLIGEQGEARVTVEELAEWAGTIPYEILTAINDRVPRLYEG
ncbi:MAG: alanine racemase [Acidobacteria bacterium]|jgi:alanine racemase|nr:alanine racemase [Acidobacteriota bacterium]